MNNDLEAWFLGVMAVWDEHWKGTDHRYGKDFASFVGERFITDFAMYSLPEYTRHLQRPRVLP